jgi:hydrogenase nickel incorporation protein HypA/HybF
MHELSLAESTVDRITEIMRAEKAETLLSVDIEIGAMSGVEPDAFEFAIPVVAEGTVLEKADIRIKSVPVKILCNTCGQKSCPGVPFLECAECGSPDVDIIEGRDFMITSMEVE